MKMNHLQQSDPELAEFIHLEERRMEQTINLIAAENHASPAIMEVVGSILNTKTIEGYPGNRFHAGCEHVDEIERLAVSRAMTLFGAEYANVQPHSGTSANLAVYFSVLKPGDKILAMSLHHGGHLSHGHPASMTSKCFSFQHYGLDPISERIDYDQIEELAEQFAPRMIVAGASSYPRLIDYKRLETIARAHGALFMVDMAHLAGLVAAGVIPSPVPHADFVTFTSYKTMMGGRGGIILARDRYGKKVDHAVFPGGQGTSAVNLIGAKALIFKLATQPEFRSIQQKTLDYAAQMARELKDRHYRLVTGGTDNHQVMIDLSETGITGSEAEKALEGVGLVLNRNVVPKDAAYKGRISGLRIGSGAIASRGLNGTDVSLITALIDRAIQHIGDTAILADISREVGELCRKYPLYRNSP